ncbi:phosphoribosyltransferase family protein [Emticicia fluvialis]|uniref:phosphoribosyltransferase family protein n=1 Tax=Emticicia fluvialis TaxID=2974474 RepID=UPI0021661E5E|nr:phosphoribosyltransferase family protein [Emticicia fluvialis]
MIHSFSLHKISDIDSFSFNPDDYSRFKFGDNLAAKLFGKNLAIEFINQVLICKYNKEQLVVISSPYSFIPTATFAMKNQFVFTLNRWLSENGFQVVQETKVSRTITYKEDYGELNAEERINLIKNDSFHIDKEFIKGKTLLFLDDIRITGSHEMMITRMLTEYNLTNETYLIYFAELVNKNIHPNIENFLNYHFVKSIFHLNSIINSEGFNFNTRLVKYILNTEPSVFNLFIQEQTTEFVNLLYDLALGNGYHIIESYKPNLNNIKKYLLNNHKLSYNGN